MLYINKIASFLDNPVLKEKAAENLKAYLLLGGLATLGTGATAYMIASNGKRVGESDEARRRRIMRNTGWATALALLGSTGLAGAHLLSSVPDNSFVYTDKYKEKYGKNPTLQDLKDFVDKVQSSVDTSNDGVISKVIQPLKDNSGNIIRGAGTIAGAGITSNFMDKNLGISTAQRLIAKNLADQAKNKTLKKGVGTLAKKIFSRTPFKLVNSAIGGLLGYTGIDALIDSFTSGEGEQDIKLKL